MKKEIEEIIELLHSPDANKQKIFAIVNEIRPVGIALTESEIRDIDLGTYKPTN